MPDEIDPKKECLKCIMKSIEKCMSSGKFVSRKKLKKACMEDFYMLTSFEIEQMLQELEINGFIKLDEMDKDLVWGVNPKFEWDEKKRQLNIDKHGVDFADIESLFAGMTVTLLDDRFCNDDERFITFGLLSGIVVAVAHTEDDEVIRIISARKGTRNEQKAYFEAIKR